MTVERIQYEIVRSGRKTVDVVVERNGRVLVRAPRPLSEVQIQRIVSAKIGWIEKTLAEWRDLNAARVIREYRNGESFLYLGRSYRLQLVSDQPQPLLLRNGRFCLRRSLVTGCDAGQAKAAFRDFFIERGSVRITQRVAYYAPKIGVRVEKIGVKELGHRWASCSPKGHLAFHWKCMMAPQTIIDYVVVHELCHFIERDHTAAFWNEVDKLIPAYAERKDWLRKNGAALDL